MIVVILPCSAGVVIGEPSPPIKDGEAAAGLFMHPDGGLDEATAVAPFGELQTQSLVAHRVVVVHLAFVPHAQHFPEAESEERRHGAAVPGRRRRAGRCPHPVELVLTFIEG